MRRIRGFTLIEVLIVVAVVGIIAGLSVQLLGNGSERSMREAQADFVGNLERVRSAVIRYNVSYEMSIASDKKSYTFTPKNASGTVQVGVPVIAGKFSSVLLEIGFGTLPGTIYRAPYARLGTGGAPTCFELIGSQDYRSVVSLVGVTGKIIPRKIIPSTVSGC